MEQKHNQLYKSLFGIGAVLVCFVLLLFIFRVPPVGAQSQSVMGAIDIQVLERRVETFFEQLHLGNTPLAFSELLRLSPLISPGAAPELTNLQTRVTDANARFGGILAWERLEVRPIGADVIAIRYVLKYDQYPVVWSFLFYRKPSTGAIANRFVVVALQFNTDLLQ